MWVYLLQVCEYAIIIFFNLRFFFSFCREVYSVGDEERHTPAPFPFSCCFTITYEWMGKKLFHHEGNNEVDQCDTPLFNPIIIITLYIIYIYYYYYFP